MGFFSEKKQWFLGVLRFFTSEGIVSDATWKYYVKTENPRNHWFKPMVFSCQPWYIYNMHVSLCVVQEMSFVPSPQKNLSLVGPETVP
jgi:hypothetical protein